MVQIRTIRSTISFRGHGIISKVQERERKGYDRKPLSEGWREARENRGRPLSMPVGSGVVFKAPTRFGKMAMGAIEPQVDRAQ